jgi:hypothetical protein
MAMGTAALGLSAAQAGTIDTFDWVTTSAVGGTTAVSGTLTLTLPSITTGSGAGTFTSTNASAALAEAEITGFSFT